MYSFVACWNCPMLKKLRMESKEVLRRIQDSHLIILELKLASKFTNLNSLFLKPKSFNK